MNRPAFLVAVSVLPLVAFAADLPPKPPLTPGDNLVVDGVPPIPGDLPERVGRYTESRAASFQDWHPTRAEMLITTRFGDTNQIHQITQPGGARTQLTFFPDRVENGSFEPNKGDYFIFHKGAGGAEFFQNYRYDFATGDVTLLTDGKSRNSSPTWSNKGDRIAYTSTRRNGADTDIYVQAPTDPKTDRMVAEVKGGGWDIADWSPDDKQLLVIEFVSVNESYLWLFDAQTGAKKEITPRPAEGAEKVSYSAARFSRDGKGIFVTTDRDSEFQRLTYIDLAGGKHSYLIPDKHFDVDGWDLSHDGKQIAFTFNENGLSTLHLMDISTANGTTKAGAKKEPTFNPPLPAAVISGIKFHRDPKQGLLAFNVAGARSPADVYTWSFGSGKNAIARWTASETGGIPAKQFVEPELVKWKTFDGKEITGFLYKPDTAKFPGKRPVIVNIHGGPEGQSRPIFLGRNNYLINELGCAMIFPNVRGSEGNGKTFLKLDNGFKREDSYKDISALFDWIKAQPQLEADRVMVTGGSYGGFMTLQVSWNYADRIRCSLDVVGMSHLGTFLKNTESYRRDLRRVEYGDERDPKMAEFMEKIAALNNADKITKPLFVVAGANDPRVPKTEAEQIVATLKKQNTPVWFLMAKDEGHGFAKKKNADFQFYSTVQFVREFLLK
ncbi:MAG TPA: prolyl oligopeptidase family serine peptidase [Chthoniobacterales bacterium]|nr:prolyl oligopeptidase family serine peptidase [Chthoniobacterales bacterium]